MQQEPTADVEVGKIPPARMPSQVFGVAASAGDLESLARLETASIPVSDGPARVGQPHALPAEVVLGALGTDPERGLGDPEVVLARAANGYNQLPEVPPTPAWRQFLDQFREMVIWLLIGADAITAALGEWEDTAAILAIVLLNALLGFIQQRKAEQALSALRKLSAPVAKVLRGGLVKMLPARELVPGDLVELEAGDHIPADARLLRGFGLQAQEAALTGESTPVDKDAEALVDPAAALGDRRNMAYLGTVMSAGKARAVVVATGPNTELGRIAGLLQGQPAEPTPLQRRLARLGRALVFLCLALVGVIFALQLARGGGLLDTFRLAVSLAVAAVPEGLPAVVTITLALGLQRMARRNALVRKLASVETLGSVTVICSDKTGTLTRNEMTVREVLAGGTRYAVTGAGYFPEGQFLKEQELGELKEEILVLRSMNGQGSQPRLVPVDPRSEGDLWQALEVGARCNHARLSRGDGGEHWQVVGDPTEAALLVAAHKAGFDPTSGSPQTLFEIPFDSERKAMSVVVSGSDGVAHMHTKGAPEVILGKCTAVRWAGQVHPLTERHREAILAANAAMASRALRVLALAHRPCDGQARGAAERDLIFAGLVGMIDPPREEVKEAVRRCREAGIRPVMITGDHPVTALAIACELGLAAEGDQAVTGQELDRIGEEELAGRADRVAVYARVSAEHKLRVVRALKGQGHVVAMTGDGVNDAPAVKTADIGIAMGVTGTDVTKEASAMVLTDDNFASIVNAVEEGRGIYDNIQKFVHYLLAGNAGLILLVFTTALIGWPVPLLPIQVLWLNLVTNSLTALAIGLEPPEPGLMRRRPRRPDEPLISADRAAVIALHGLFTGAVALVGFAVVYRGDEANLPEARVVAFCVVGLAHVFYAFACRSREATSLELGWASNPYLVAAVAACVLMQLAVVAVPFLHPVFGVEAYPVRWEWWLIAVLSALPVSLIEATKWLRSLLNTQGGQR